MDTSSGCSNVGAVLLRDLGLGSRGGWGGRSAGIGASVAEIEVVTDLHIVAEGLVVHKVLFLSGILSVTLVSLVEIQWLLLLRVLRVLSLAVGPGSLRFPASRRIKSEKRHVQLLLDRSVLAVIDSKASLIVELKLLKSAMNPFVISSCCSVDADNIFRPG